MDDWVEKIGLWEKGARSWCAGSMVCSLAKLAYDTNKGRRWLGYRYALLERLRYEHAAIGGNWR